MNESYCLFTLRAKMRRRIEVRYKEENNSHIIKQVVRLIQISKTVQDSKKKEK